MTPKIGPGLWNAFNDSCQNFVKTDKYHHVMNDTAHEQYLPQDVPPAQTPLAWQPSVTDYHSAGTNNLDRRTEANADLINKGVLTDLQFSSEGAPLSAPAGVNKYDAYVAKTVNLDEIDPSQLSHDAQFGGAAGNWFRYAGRAAWHSIEGMTQPGATDHLIFGSIVNAKHYYAENNLQTVSKDISQLSQDAMQAVWNAPGAFEKMTLEQKSKASAEVTFNAFFFFGAKAPISTEVSEQMGLKYLSRQQLENLEIEEVKLPNLKLERDAFSIKASIKGDHMAYVRVELPAPGIIDVTGINRGKLRTGMGSELLVETLKHFGVLPTTELRFSNIENTATLEAFGKGIDPEDSTLGQLGKRTIEQFGLKPSNYRFESVNEKLNLIIETKKP